MLSPATLIALLAAAPAPQAQPAAGDDTPADAAPAVEPAGDGAPADAAPTPTGEPADGDGEDTPDTAPKDVTRYRFTGLDIEGELRTPALLQFLAKIAGAFETLGLPHRSFMPELEATLDEDVL